MSFFESTLYFFLDFPNPHLSEILLLPFQIGCFLVLGPWVRIKIYKKQPHILFTALFFFSLQNACCALLYISLTSVLISCACLPAVVFCSYVIQVVAFTPQASAIAQENGAMGTFMVMSRRNERCGPFRLAYENPQLSWIVVESPNGYDRVLRTWVYIAASRAVCSLTCLLV